MHDIVIEQVEMVGSGVFRRKFDNDPFEKCWLDHHWVDDRTRGGANILRVQIPEHIHTADETTEYDRIPYVHTLDADGNEVPYNPVDRDGDNIHGIDWVNDANTDHWRCWIQTQDCEVGPSYDLDDYDEVDRVDYDGRTCNMVEKRWPWARPQPLSECARPYVCDYHSNAFWMTAGTCAAITSSLIF